MGSRSEECCHPTSLSACNSMLGVGGGECRQAWCKSMWHLSVNDEWKRGRDLVVAKEGGGKGGGGGGWAEGA